MPATTDADRLAHLWSRSDAELGPRDSATLVQLTRNVVHRAARRAARMRAWSPGEAALEDVAADAFLVFRERAAAYRERGEEARGGILLLVVDDVVGRHHRLLLRSPVELAEDQPEPPPDLQSGDFAPAARELDAALRANRELGLRGIARLVARRRDPEVELFAQTLLTFTTDWEALEADPLAAVAEALQRHHGLTRAQVTCVKLRAMRRPEVSAMLQRFSSLRGC